MKIIDNNANDLNFMSNRPDERENTDKSTYRLQKKISYLKQRTVYRFISLDVFQKIIQNKKIYFSLPSKWSDTFEESFIKAIQIAKIEKALDPIFIREILCSKGRYYCSCWTKTAESQRFWDEYGYNNTALRIEIDLEDLLVHHNINCYDVKYADFFTLDDFLLTKESNFMNNKFFVNEDGEFEGDPFCKSSEQRYVNYIVSAIPSLWIDEESRDDDNIGISIERYLSTKQLKYSWENEVRLFINCKYLDDASISEKQNKYTARVFNEYNTKKVINFNLPLDATYQLKSNTIFKSVMCHPKMSNDNRIYIRKLMNENRMETVPIVKSTFE